MVEKYPPRSQHGRPVQFSSTITEDWPRPLLEVDGLIKEMEEETRRKGNSSHFADIPKTTRQPRDPTTRWTWIDWLLRYNVSTSKTSGDLWRKVSASPAESPDTSRPTAPTRRSSPRTRILPRQRNRP